MIFEFNIASPHIQNEYFDKVSRSFDFKMIRMSHWFPEQYKNDLNYDDIIQDSGTGGQQNKGITKESIKKGFYEGSKKDKSISEKPSKHMTKMTRDGISKSKLSASCVELNDGNNDELAISGIFFRKLLLIQNQINDIEFDQEYSLEDYRLIFEILWENRPLIDMSLFQDFKEDDFNNLFQNTSFEDKEGLAKNYNFPSMFFMKLMVESMTFLRKITDFSAIKENEIQMCKNLFFSANKSLEQMKKLLFISVNHDINFGKSFFHFLDSIKLMKTNLQNYDLFFKNLFFKNQQKKKQNLVWSSINLDWGQIEKEIRFFFESLVKKLILKNHPKFFEQLVFHMQLAEPLGKIIWDRVAATREYLSKKINEKQEDFDTKPNADQTYQLFNKNFSIANLIFYFDDNCDDEIFLPLNDPDYPVFSIHDLDSMSYNHLRDEQKLALLQYAYHKTSPLEEIKYDKMELNHSEKALLGYIYQNSKKIIKKLTELLKDQNHDLTPFKSIDIQVYTFRYSCVYCESLLSNPNTVLFNCLLKEFLQLHPNDDYPFQISHESICIYKVLSFTLYMQNSAFEDKEKNVPQYKKSKYLQKDYVAKDFFSYEFLKRYLTGQSKFYHKRTFFVSGVKEDGKSFKTYLKKFKHNEIAVAKILNSRAERFIFTFSFNLFISYNTVKTRFGKIYQKKKKYKF